jgi:hypothetical protein
VILGAPLLDSIANIHAELNKVTVQDSKLTVLNIAPSNTINLDNPFVLKIYESNFYRNFGYTDAILKAKTNSIIHGEDSIFEDNYNLGRGGVILADAKGS